MSEIEKIVDEILPKKEPFMCTCYIEKCKSSILSANASGKICLKPLSEEEVYEIICDDDFGFNFVGEEEELRKLAQAIIKAQRGG